MQQDNEKRSVWNLRFPFRVAMISAIDRLTSISNAIYGRIRLWINDIIGSITYREPASTSYRYLAHQIVSHFAGSQSCPCIVFSSPDSAEVSSDVLLMVAFFLHDEIGSKVLLVDGTFRSWGVSDRFGFSGESGFTDYLYESGHTLENFIKPTASPGVFILPAGNVFGQGVCPVETRSVTSFLDELDQFDYILIQQGSITLDTRYLAFAQSADLVILYLEEGSTLVRDFEACMKIFRDYKIQNVRLILSDASG